MTLLARSADSTTPVQTYYEHITGVTVLCDRSLLCVQPHMPREQFLATESLVKRSSLFHDLGKADDYCQDVLYGRAKGRMPNHTDAGTAMFLLEGDRCCASLVSGHHIGLKDYSSELRDLSPIRDRVPGFSKNILMKDHTDENLDRWLALHKQVVPGEMFSRQGYKHIDANIMRLAMSCLVSSDRMDAARHKQHFIPNLVGSIDSEQYVPLIDNFVLEKSREMGGEIAKLRSEVYQACRYSEIYPAALCSAPVGLAKTVATLVYACRTNPTKIVYVAPLVTIISQTAKFFRSFFSDVGEHQHRAPYKSGTEMERVMTETWAHPLIATSSLQFFHTLWSNHPSMLGKLFRLAGATIIIDECHTLPIRLWPLILHSLGFLIKTLGCKILFVSGTMVKPWENEEVLEYCKWDIPVPSLIPEELSSHLFKKEDERVKVEMDSTPLNLGAVCHLISSAKGPTIAMFNTVNNAARVAHELQKQGVDVLHLSTSLCPKDQDAVIVEVVRRLAADKNGTHRWVLVCTSCVEAGVDFSFRYGFREKNGLLEISQMKGRVNRNREYLDSFIMIFNLDITKGSEFNFHPDFVTPGRIFDSMFRQGKSGVANSNEYFERLASVRLTEEISADQDEEGTASPKLNIDSLMQAEKSLKFQTVSRYAKIINDERAVVLINEDLLDQNPSVNEMVRNSVQVLSSKVEKLPISESPKRPGVLVWMGRYDSFLGYMAENSANWT